ncbi:hypothetical protein KM043_006053 [Ampulex compressa]|nr:hypothetical protein KM043_006053 [Ampulex compressa]
MDDANVNGGNADVARENPNLELVAMPDLQEVEEKAASTTEKMDGQEVNGDLKGLGKNSPTPPVRRKLRKFKANSTSTIETDAVLGQRGRKRKLSEPDDMSSEESMEFNGFDVQGANELEPGSHVLKKLIAEAEVAEAQLIKRYRYSMSKKSFDGKDRKDDDLDSDDNKTQAYETEHLLDVDKIKKEKESDKSETDSTDIPNSSEFNLDIQKIEGISVKSTNSSSATSSPAMSHKSKEPFKYGWKRELVFRASTDSSLKRMADIYYYTPKGKKVRSFREVAEFLNTKELTIDNFTFFKEPIGIDDPEKEIIRDAKRVRGSLGAVCTPPRKSFSSKKTLNPRKPAEESPVSASVPTTTSLPITLAPVSVSGKVVSKLPKVSSSGFKVKVPVKKTPQIKIKTPMEENEMLPPQRSVTNSRRNQQPIIEKSTPTKTKRLLTPKVQEPCSIRCSTSMGLIPSLQCRICLCLYHPECVDGMEFAGSDDYICKNCQQDSDESHPSINPSLTPPPLIPISLLGVQNAKSKHQVNLTPPKLQRIPKSESADPQTPSMAKASKIMSTTLQSPSSVDKKEGNWFVQTENEFLQSHDGTIPKPAQNIALMGGKKYIVVPKNNAMAVQPAITVRPDKIGDKPPLLQDGSLIDISNTVENSLVMKSRVPPFVKALDKDSNENMSNTDVLKDIAQASCMQSTLSSCSEDKSEANDNSTKIMDSLLINEKETKLPNIKSDYMIEAERQIISHELTEKKSDTEVSNMDNLNVIIASNEILKTNLPLATSNVGTVLVTSKRKQSHQDTDHQQHFMDSVCAGYHALLRIFQYLKVQELLRAARVCKMWRDLAAHPSLWKTVRMKNSQVTDWDGLADTLQRRGTQHLDLRKMLVAGESDGIWKKFLMVIPRVTSLVKLELCRCPVMVVEEVIKNCPQLEVLSAMSIKCDSLNLESVGNLRCCQELRLKAISGMSLQEDLTPLQELLQLTQLSLTSVKELGKKKIDIIQTLINLETLELGECSDFPDKFGTMVLIKLQKLERLRLEKGQGSCCTFDILDGVSKLQNLSQMELVNFDVKNGFDKCLANCKNIKRLLIIPTYISQSATSNNMVLGGVTELSNNLTHFVWGVTLELLRVTELFVDQCNLMSKQVTGDSIPVLKPVPCLKLIEDIEDENDNQKGDDKQQLNLTSPQVDILPLPQLQKLLLTALPKTRVKILKIPFHATWRQSISDTATQ